MFPTEALHLYPESKIEYQKARYEKAEKRFFEIYGESPEFVVSAPGRSEICGNHTDHNMGKAVGASIDLDVLIFLKKCENTVNLLSEGYMPITVDLSDLSLNENEKGTSLALIKGVAAYFVSKGYKIGGFKGYCISDVLRGSGLSSSAAFEVAVATAFNELYNGGKIPPMEIALASHFAECEYFGKACGTLDQISCAFGGMVGIDFENPAAPKVAPVKFDFQSTGYLMVITDVKSDHADLTDDYVAIRRDMESVARVFGESYLRKVNFAVFLENLPKLRKAVPERAIIRAFHFFNENNRVDNLLTALRENNFASFLENVNSSGNSSFKYLQNIYSAKNPASQAISLALCISQNILPENTAYRVHGGGFGGTIQAYMPENVAKDYMNKMNSVFGEGASFTLQIRPTPPVMIKL